MHGTGMDPSALEGRLARLDEVPALGALMDRAIGELLAPYLDVAQIAASRVLMGVDTQLIRDGTYYVVEHGGRLAGCGGWSRRATLYGADTTPGRNSALLDPAKDPARMRAMYTDPEFVRRGVGRLVLSLCEAAARREGFRHAELVATLAGIPLYDACGYRVLERFEDARGGAAVPLARMGKEL